MFYVKNVLHNWKRRTIRPGFGTEQSIILINENNTHTVTWLVSRASKANDKDIILCRNIRIILSGEHAVVVLGNSPESSKRVHLHLDNHTRQKYIHVRAQKPTSGLLSLSHSLHWRGIFASVTPPQRIVDTSRGSASMTWGLSFRRDVPACTVQESKPTTGRGRTWVNVPKS